MSDRYDDAAEIERLNVKVNLARLQRDYEVQRREDVVGEYQKAGRSWDTSRARLTEERDEARAESGVAWEAHSQVVTQNDELRAALTRVEARCEDAEDNRRWLTAFEIRDALKTLYAAGPEDPS